MVSRLSCLDQYVYIDVNVYLGGGLCDEFCHDRSLGFACAPLRRTDLGKKCKRECARNSLPECLNLFRLDAFTGHF